MGIMSFLSSLFGGGSDSKHSHQSNREHVIRFDPDLIARLKADHAKIYESFVNIGKHAEAKEWAESKGSVATFAANLERHLVIESIRFYKYVEFELQDDKEAISIITEFKSEMEAIGEVLKGFLDKYEANNRNKPWDSERKKSIAFDLQGIGAALVSRVQREEKTLYPLYRD